MHFYHSTLFSTKTLKAIALIFLISLVTISAQAQRRSSAALTYGGGGSYGSANEDGWGIAIGGGYEMPTGDLGTTFKGAPVFSISAIHNWGNFTFNTTIGYASFRPKLDTTFIYYDGQEAGYIKYGHYSSFEIYAGAAYNIAVADNAKFYFGFDAGSYYNHLDVSSGDTYTGYTVDDETVSSGDQSAGYIAPKIGVKFVIGSNLLFGFEGKYNFMLASESGSGDAYDSGYATDVTKTYTVSASLTVMF